MKLSNEIQRKIQVLIIILFGLTPLLWFDRSGFVWGYGDIVFPMHELDLTFLIKQFSAWSDHSYYGLQNVQVGKVFPLLIIFTIIRSLGFSIITAEKTFFIFLCMLPGLTFLYLLRIIRKRESVMAETTATLFYMFNMFTLVHFTTMQWATLLMYSIAPLLLGLVMRFIETEETGKYASLIAISSLLMSSISVNPVTYSVTWLAPLSYLLYRIFKKPSLLLIRFALTTTALVLLLNLFWVVPYIIFFSSESSNSFNTMEEVDLEHHLNWSSSKSKLYYLFRSLGKWGFHLKGEGSYYYPYNVYYSQSIFILLLYLAPLLAVYGILYSKSTIKEYIFFMLMLLVGFFLSKGINPPVGGIYRYVFNNIPGFWVFRESFPRFFTLSAISLTVLLYSAIVQIIHKKNRKFRALIIISIICCILISVWPMFSGDVVPRRKGDLPGSFFKFPSHWINAMEHLNSLPKGTRIFVSPNSLPYQRYLWEFPYYGQDIIPYIIDQEILSTNSGGGYTRPNNTEHTLRGLYSILNFKTTYYEWFSKRWKEPSNHNFGAFLGLLGVEFIMQRDDLDWSHFNRKEEQNAPPERINWFLQQQKNIEVDTKFTNITLYKIKDRIRKPNVYIPRKLVFVDDSIYNVLRREFLNISVRNAYVFANDQLEFTIPFDIAIVPKTKQRKQSTHNVISSLEKTYNLENTTTYVAYESQYSFENMTAITEVRKISPNKYIAKVHSTAPFFIVLGTSFSKNWGLFVSDYILSDLETIYNKPIRTHFLANNIANGWYVDKAGSHTLTFYYKPEFYYNISQVVSFCTFITLIIGVILFPGRK